jgi:hypothetical protein
VSQTPHNPTDALQQSTLVKNRIVSHQGSSPTQLFSTINALAKGIEILAHENTLLTAEIRTLRKANEALSKRRRAKKTLVRQVGALEVEQAGNIVAQKEAEEQVRRDKCSREGGSNEGQSNMRRCGTCGKPGHNARTCQEDVDTFSLSESEDFE